MEDNEFKMLRDCLSLDEITKIPDSICKKLDISIKTKFDEFITAKAIFEVNRKNLGKLILYVSNLFNQKFLYLILFTYIIKLVHT